MTSPTALYTPTAAAPLAGHALRAELRVETTTYRGHELANRFINVSVECQMPAGAEHPCTSEDGTCEVGEFLVEGEADVDTYRGPAPVRFREGPILVWREVDTEAIGRPDCAAYMWAWRYADETAGDVLADVATVFAESGR
jgi:hypothetical protein